MIYKPIKIEITKEMIDKAIARDPGAYNDKSFMNGKGNRVGFLGEYMFHQVRPDFEHVDDFNYDFKGAFGKKAVTVEIKCKAQNVAFEPKHDYEASICKDSLHQKPLYYAFCRVYFDKATKTYPHGWVIGAITRKKYFEKAEYLEKDTKSGNNDWTVTQDCYNLKYSKLQPLNTKYMKTKEL